MTQSINPADAVREALELFARLANDHTYDGSPEQVAAVRAHIAALTALVAEQAMRLDAAERMASRYTWLRGRLLGADFDYGDDEEKCCVVVFHWPEDGWISADLDATIDAAMEQTP